MCPSNFSFRVYFKVRKTRYTWALPRPNEFLTSIMNALTILAAQLIDYHNIYFIIEGSIC